MMMMMMMLTVLLTAVKDNWRGTNESHGLHLGSNDSDSHRLVDDTRNFFGQSGSVSEIKGIDSRLMAVSRFRRSNVTGEHRQMAPSGTQADDQAQAYLTEKSGGRNVPVFKSYNKVCPPSWISLPFNLQTVSTS